MEGILNTANRVNIIIVETSLQLCFSQQMVHLRGRGHRVQPPRNGELQWVVKMTIKVSLSVKQIAKLAFTF